MKAKKKIKTTKLKTPRQLERHMKGVANHWRIAILFEIAKTKDLSVENITQTLNCHFKTVSDHTKRLEQAGLIRKKHVGRMVVHRLSPYGEKIHRFLKAFQNA